MGVGGTAKKKKYATEGVRFLPTLHFHKAGHPCSFGSEFGDGMSYGLRVVEAGGGSKGSGKGEKRKGAGEGEGQGTEATQPRQVTSTTPAIFF